MGNGKEYVLEMFTDLISDFLYYNRKEDEEMPLGRIEEIVNNGDLTVDEMVEAFRKELTEGLGQ